MTSRRLDLLLPWQDDTDFDVAFIIGGLHRCVRGMRQVIDNVSRMLKPGGLFSMPEPNALFFLERARKFWYRHDRMFDADNEVALDHNEPFAAAFFELRSLKYPGGPAHFIVLQNMILRVARPVKNAISGSLIWAERLWDRLPGRRLQNTFLACWQRRSWEISDSNNSSRARLACLGDSAQTEPDPTKTTPNH